MDNFFASVIPDDIFFFFFFFFVSVLCTNANHSFFMKYILVLFSASSSTGRLSGSNRFDNCTISCMKRFSCC